jgi:hypothetical protein
MSTKFFRSSRALYKFDPESFKSFVYGAGGWIELKEPERIEEIRFRTIELSLSEALSTCGAAAA